MRFWLTKALEVTVLDSRPVTVDRAEWQVLTVHLVHRRWWFWRVSQVEELSFRQLGYYPEAKIYATGEKTPTGDAKRLAGAVWAYKAVQAEYKESTRNQVVQEYMRGRDRRLRAV